MKRFNMICSVVVFITIAVFLITLSQNLVVRSSEVYAFYFNDSQAVSKLYTELSSGDIAKDIADFMNEWRPAEFQIYEDTGYDLQGIFDADEGYNMLRIKLCVDISSILCVISFILTVSVYWYLIKSNEKKLLRTGCKSALALAAGFSAVYAVILSTEGGRSWLAQLLKMRELGEESALLTILGTDFVHMAIIFYLIITLILMCVFAYVSDRLTRPPRIFY